MTSLLIHAALGLISTVLAFRLNAHLYARGSGGQDMIIANVVLFPLWTMIDGPRRGLRSCWIFFVVSLVTSFACAIALYLAAQERQVRWNAAHAESGT